MKDFQKHKQTYIEHIEKTIESLRNINSKWINKRSWYDDLRKFDIGDNVLQKIFTAKDSSPPDKKAFEENIIKQAQINESVFTVDHEIKGVEKEEHEFLLSYEWWIRLYNLVRRENKFDKDQIIELENKRKYFFRLVRDIEIKSK